MSLRLSIALMALIVAVGGCRSREHSERVPLKEELAQPASVDVTSLCEHIKDIKLLPNKNFPVSDPAFNALAAAGDQVIPCLIRKISDETPRKVSCGPGFSVLPPCLCASVSFFVRKINNHRGTETQRRNFA